MYLKFVSATSASFIQLPTRHVSDYPMCHAPTHIIFQANQLMCIHGRRYQWTALTFTCLSKLGLAGHPWTFLHFWFLISVKVCLFPHFQSPQTHTFLLVFARIPLVTLTPHLDQCSAVLAGIPASWNLPAPLWLAVSFSKQELILQITNDLSYNRLRVLETTASTFGPLLLGEQNDFGHLEHNVWRGCT